ncbi:MAG: enoyl-CoA hydratase-related protein [Pseudomonadales bacterium]|jgi:2-(1,2-epoxy-1,2-dihydrophenyl)acetyl-CoA isomerase
MAENLIEQHENGVCTLIMNRPEARNAMGGDMMEALKEAIPRVAADRNVRAVVLTGAGGAFCAGGDVKGFASEPRSGKGEGPSLEVRVQGLRSGMEISRLLHEMPKPTLAIIPGAAAGAGLSLALACDLRFALDTAKITTAFSKIGASGDYGGSYFLPYLVGAAKARELYFSAEVISGQQAYEMGLVNKVASKETFEAESKAYGEYLASLPTVAVGYMKKNLNAAQHGSLSDVFDLEAMHMMRCFETNDHKEAAKAFVNKQKPVFNGK